MSRGSIELEIDRLVFRSQYDEDSFFEWLRKLRCVEDLKGKGSSLFLLIKTPVGNANIRELLALFFRYDLPMKQLAAFKTKKNATWFSSPRAYWSARVFKS